MKKLYRFLRYNKRKLLTIRIYILTAWYRLCILMIKPKKLEKYWGIRNEETDPEESLDHYRYARVVSYYVDMVASKTPWESLCLVRALTARYLLNRKKIPSTMYLGLKKDENDKLVAHAWLRCGSLYVTGGNGKEYAMVAKFANLRK